MFLVAPGRNRTTDTRLFNFRADVTHSRHPEILTRYVLAVAKLLHHHLRPGWLVSDCLRPAKSVQRILDCEQRRCLEL